MQREGGIVSIAFPKEINGTWQLLSGRVNPPAGLIRNTNPKTLFVTNVGNCFRDSCDVTHTTHLLLGKFT